MISRVISRSLSAPLLFRVSQKSSYSSLTLNILQTSGSHSRISFPLAPIQYPQQFFQTRSYGKSKNKKTFQYSSPSQPTNNRNGAQPQQPIEQPIEPATIPATSRAATATEGGIDGTELPGDASNIPIAQTKQEEIAKTGTSGQRYQEQSESSTSRDANAGQSKARVSETTSSATGPTELYGQEINQQQSSRPLPDLTQGIPSTLDAELAQSSKKTDPKSLNVTEDPSESEGGKDLPRSAYISSFEKRRTRVANYFYAFTLFAAISSTIYLGRNWETEEEEQKYKDAPNGWGIGLFFNRVGARLGGTLDYYNEPAFPKLLPNTDPAWERPYTLVLSLEDLLVHSEWDREHGWRMAKRPGVDYFLRYLSQYYELVIFTSVPSMIGQPIINKLDPYHIVMWPLFREATRYKKGEYIKDLSYLNRPLNKIILLDTEEAHAALQPENAIITKKWKGNPQDKELVSFIPFLEYVASMEFGDVRDVLKSFEGTHIPSEYAKRESIAREKFMKNLAAEKGKGRGRRSMGGLASLLGGKPQGVGVDGMEQSLSEGFAQGKMFQDQVRERGQKQYAILEKEIRENGEKWLKEMAAEEKKMNEEAMKGMKNSITGVLPFGTPGEKPPPASSTP